jgi:hypothetical protein
MLLLCGIMSEMEQKETQNKCSFQAVNRVLLEIQSVLLDTSIRGQTFVEIFFLALARHGVARIGCYAKQIQAKSLTPTFLVIWQPGDDRSLEKWNP